MLRWTFRTACFLLGFAFAHFIALMLTRQLAPCRCQEGKACECPERCPCIQAKENK